MSDRRAQACWARTAKWWWYPYCIRRGDEGTTEYTQWMQMLKDRSLEVVLVLYKQ